MLQRKTGLSLCTAFLILLNVSDVAVAKLSEWRISLSLDARKLASVFKPTSRWKRVISQPARFGALSVPPAHDYIL